MVYAVIGMGLAGMVSAATAIAAAVMIVLATNLRLTRWRREHPVLTLWELIAIRQRWGPFN